MGRGEELELAAEAVTCAARLVLRVAAAGAGGVAKDDQSPVTVADFAAQALISEALLRARPADPVVGEEGSAPLREPGREGLLEAVRRQVALARGELDAAALCGLIDRAAHREPCPRFWTLDPVDGTRGFISGGAYAVGVALVEAGRPVVAAVACPTLAAGPGAPPGALFLAARGAGASVAPLARPAERRPLHVSARPPEASRFAESLAPEHSDQAWSARVAAALGIAAPPLRADSMAKYALLAAGEVDLYLRRPGGEGREKCWDHAPGVLLVEEAGGAVTDLAGAPLDFSAVPWLRPAGGIVGSNGRWHAQALAAARAALGSPAGLAPEPPRRP